MIKKLLSIALAIIIIASVFCSSSAHGVIYKTKMVGENTLRVTLEWDNPDINKDIVITSFVVNNGKDVDIAYEVTDQKPGLNYKDFDLRTMLPPLSIRLYNIADYDKPIFEDIDGHYAQRYIHHLHDAGIVNGRNDYTFCPEDSLSRAEFTVLMVKALSLRGSKKNVLGFTDIDDHWGKNYILIAAENGILSGYGDGTVRPDNKITVAEVCTVIARAFSFNTFNDGIYEKLTNGEWYSGYVEKMFNCGIIKTEDVIYTDFDETIPISRADVSIMLSRAISTY